MRPCEPGSSAALLCAAPKPPIPHCSVVYLLKESFVWSCTVTKMISNVHESALVSLFGASQHASRLLAVVSPSLLERRKENIMQTPDAGELRAA